jgi:hypothetical protein
MAGPWLGGTQRFLGRIPTLLGRQGALPDVRSAQPGEIAGRPENEEVAAHIFKDQAAPSTPCPPSFCDRLHALRTASASTHPPGPAIIDNVTGLESVEPCAAPGWTPYVARHRADGLCLAPAAALWLRLLNVPTPPVQRRQVGPTTILLGRHGFQMVGPDAVADATKVIDLVPIRNVPSEPFVGDPVGHVAIHGAVPALVPGPEPAPARPRFDVDPEPLQQRSGRPRQWPVRRLHAAPTSGWFSRTSTHGEGSPRLPRAAAMASSRAHGRPAASLKNLLL